jgi:predicted ATP-dependent Lon-type protease
MSYLQRLSSIAPVSPQIQSGEHSPTTRGNQQRQNTLSDAPNELYSTRVNQSFDSPTRSVHPQAASSLQQLGTNKPDFNQEYIIHENINSEDEKYIRDFFRLAEEILNFDYKKAEIETLIFNKESINKTISYLSTFIDKIRLNISEKNPLFEAFIAIKLRLLHIELEIDRRELKTHQTPPQVCGSAS